MVKVNKLTYNKKVWLLVIVFGVLSTLKIFVLHGQDFISSHLSNFVLTGFLLSGSMLTFRKPSLKKIKRDFNQSLVVCLGLNVVLELGHSIGTINLPQGITLLDFNTADPVDAVFGIAAIILVVLMRKYWIKYPAYLKNNGN